MPRELNSWKEIADHLGVTVRTAQRWEEERGLPVTRLPGGRGRVSANLEELDRWRDREDPGGRPMPHQDWGVPLPGRGTARRKRLFRRLAAAAALLVAAAAGLYYLLALPGQPAAWTMEGTTLAVWDQRGRAVWHHEFDESLYARNYHSTVPGAPEMVWITDLEGDGDRETLAIAVKHDSAVLYCFSARGAVRWIFDPSVAVSAAGIPQVGHMRVMNFLVDRLREGRPNSIVVSTAHSPYWPCRIVILDADGNVEREYWHAGHIGNVRDTLAAADMDKDGVKEIYLLGVSNARKQAALVVLDPRRMEGASQEEIERYRIDGKSPGRELARISFGHSCIQEPAGTNYNLARSIAFADDGIRIEHRGGGGVAGPAHLHGLLPARPQPGPG